MIIHITIISGGQSGVDRAALDFALKFGLQAKGWCPKNRMAEDGRIPKHYPLTELASTAYADRTIRNVQISDALLLLYCDTLDEGSQLAVDTAKSEGLVVYKINLNQYRTEQIDHIKESLTADGVSQLNIAGSRESQSPGIYNKSLEVINKIFL